MPVKTRDRPKMNLPTRLSLHVSVKTLKTFSFLMTIKEEEEAKGCIVMLLSLFCPLGDGLLTKVKTGFWFDQIDSLTWFHVCRFYST